MTESILKATHTGTLKIGSITIPCAVLENGQRVVTEHGITTALKSRSGASKRLKREMAESGAHLPIFIAPKNLEPFISDELRAGLNQPIMFQVGKIVILGYLADYLPQICDVWLKTREAKALRKDQEGKAASAEILMRGLAHVGIIALVDEATGYQAIRHKEALQKILEKYISKELMKWQKRFPDEFYKQIYRLKGWQWEGRQKNPPQVVGRYTNDIIYERLAPNILTELEKLNPPKENGERPNKHHQWLTDTGNSHLNEHLIGVITLMRASANWGSFKRSLVRAFPKVDEELQLELDDE